MGKDRPPSIKDAAACNFEGTTSISSREKSGGRGRRGEERYVCLWKRTTILLSKNRDRPVLLKKGRIQSAASTIWAPGGGRGFGPKAKIADKGAFSVPRKEREGDVQRCLRGVEKKNA